MSIFDSREERLNVRSRDLFKSTASTGGIIYSWLLQENNDRILQEDGFTPIALEQR